MKWIGEKAVRKWLTRSERYKRREAPKNRIIIQGSKETNMQPLGRKSIQLPDAKHHPKFEGKNIRGWWEHICSENKKGERLQSKLKLLKFDTR